MITLKHFQSGVPNFGNFLILALVKLLVVSEMTLVFVKFIALLLWTTVQCFFCFELLSVGQNMGQYWLILIRISYMTFGRGPCLQTNKDAEDFEGFDISSEKT